MFSGDSVFALDLLWEWRDTLQPGLSPTASIEATLNRMEHHDVAGCECCCVARLINVQAAWAWTVQRVKSQMAL